MTETRWRLVPVEATEEMRCVGAMAIDDNYLAPALSCWVAMLSASPSPGEDVVERIAAIIREAGPISGVPEDAARAILAMLTKGD